MKISCPMILKNEGATIYRALNSVKDFVDEFVIGIDGRTSDNTRMEIDRFLIDNNDDIDLKIYSLEWKDNFASARNEGFSKCRYETKFILDGHESVDSHSAHVIDEKLKRNDPKFEIALCEVVMYGQQGKQTVFEQPRFFRGDFKMHNKSHNVLLFDQEKNKTVKIGGVQIHHARSKKLSNERIEQRKGMNIDDLKQRIAKGDRRAQAQIACEYMAFRDWPKAVTHFREYLKNGIDLKREEYQKRINLAMCLFYNQQYDEAEQELYKAQTCNDDGRNAHLVFLAELYYYTGHFEKAIHFASHATVIPKPEQFYFLYPTFYTVEPWKIMHKSYRKIGYEKGAEWCQSMINKFGAIDDLDRGNDQSKKSA